MSPRAVEARHWRDIFTGRIHSSEELALRDLLGTLPAAVLISES